MKASSFYIKIADRNIRVVPLTDQLVRFCEDYVIPVDRTREVDFSVTLTSQDIDRERRKSLEEPGAPFSEAYLESLALARKVSDALFKFDTLMIHGSCLEMDGAACLFTAPSGVGKSTHARLWRTRFGDRVKMINDDKPFVAVTDTGAIAYGSPWDGTHHLSTNKSAPLKAICLIHRDTLNHIESLSAEEAYPELFGQVYRPKGDTKRLMSLVDSLAGRVDLYALGCNMEIEAAEVAYEGMRP